jgi:hypothetical protein
MTKAEALRRYAESLSGHAQSGFYVSIIRRFLASGAAMTRQGVTDYLRGLEARGMRPSSVDLHMRAIKRFCAVAGVKWPSTDWHWDRSAKPSERVAATTEFVRALVASSAQADRLSRAWLLLSTLYGSRASELAAWQQRYLAADAEAIYIVRVKEGDNRWYWLPPHLRPLLEGVAERPSIPIAAYEAWRVLCESAGISVHGSRGAHTAWHTIRRGLVSELRRRGVPDGHIRAFIGWSGPAAESGMVELYATPTAYLETGGQIARARPEMEIPADPKAVDQAVWQAHPFLGLWSKAEV